MADNETRDFKILEDDYKDGKIYRNIPDPNPDVYMRLFEPSRLYEPDDGFTVPPPGDSYPMEEIKEAWEGFKSCCPVNTLEDLERVHGGRLLLVPARVLLGSLQPGPGRLQMVAVRAEEQEAEPQDSLCHQHLEIRGERKVLPLLCPLVPPSMLRGDGGRRDDNGPGNLLPGCSAESGFSSLNGRTPEADRIDKAEATSKRRNLPTDSLDLTFIYLDEHRFNYNPKPNPLDRALDAARRAVDSDPVSQRAHHALAEVGDVPEPVELRN
jgi:hypothetical protein